MNALKEKERAPTSRLQVFFVFFVSFLKCLFWCQKQYSVSWESFFFSCEKQYSCVRNGIACLENSIWYLFYFKNSILRLEA